MKRSTRSVLLFSLILTLSASNILSAKPKKKIFKARQTSVENTEESVESENGEEPLVAEENQEIEIFQEPEPVKEPEVFPKKEESQKSAEISPVETDSEEEISGDPVLKVRPWYIYKKTAKKVAAGPFDTVEQALEAWILNPKKYKSKKGYFIGRDGVLFTDSPDTYYSRKYNRIKSELEEKNNADSTSAAEQNQIEAENLDPALTDAETSEKVFSEETTGTTQKTDSAETAESTELSSENLLSDTDKEFSFSVPEFTPQSQTPVFTGNDYQKTYLSDFITKEVFELPDSDFSDLAEDFTDDPNETDSRGVSLLMKAAKEGNDWKLRTLLAAGASVNARDKDGWTPLMYAVRYQSNLSVLELLLAKNAEVKTTNNFSLSPLIIAACFNDNPDIIRKLLSFYSPSDKEVQKAFVQLISTQQTDHFALLSKVKLFLEFGLPVNSYYEGKTPLMYACKYCSSTKVIKLLLDKNAAVTVRSTEGKTAFDYAQTNKTLPRDEIYWSLNKR